MHQGLTPPPLLPEQFERELGEKTFYNREHDMPLVSSLYGAVFVEQMGTAVELDFRHMGWQDAEAAQLARVVAADVLPKLRRLNFSWNEISDKGALKIAAALSTALPPLERLDFKGNPLQQAGNLALRDAFRACRTAHKGLAWSEERREEAATQIQAVKRGKAARTDIGCGRGSCAPPPLGAVDEASPTLRPSANRQQERDTTPTAPATEEQVTALSEQLNAKMHELFAAKYAPTMNAKAGWFRLFKHIDDDGSGLISYDEFKGMVRDELRLSPLDLPERTLKAAWLALDDDGSGMVSTGEFGTFMKLGTGKSAG